MAVNINLLIAGQAIPEIEKKRRKNIVLASLAGLVVYLIGLFIFAGYHYYLSRACRRNSVQIQSLTKQINLLNSVESNQYLLVGKVAVIKAVRSSSANNSFKRNIDTLYSILPEKVYFKTIKVDLANDLKVTGVAPDAKSLSEFIKKLQTQTDHNFSGAIAKFIVREDEGGYRFEIHLVSGKS